MLTRYINYALISSLTLMLSGCFESSYDTRTFYAMDTFLSITMKKDDMPKLDNAIEYINTLADNITSDEEKVAAAPINTNISVGDDFMALYNVSKEFASGNDGAYDPTASTITKHYGFGSDEYQIPDASTLKRAIKTAGFDKLIIIDNNTVKKSTDVEIHFGAAGKGYIADKAAQYLNEQGVNGFVINIGGDMIVSGDKEGKPFVIGITNPMQPNTVINVVKIIDRGVATSGNYERSFKDAKGETINHIFDVKTGESINTHSSVSVITDNGTMADIYATYYYTLPIEKIADECIENNTPVLVIDNENNMHKLCAWEEYEQK